MKKNLNYYQFLLFLTIMIAAGQAKAQDLHFSQYFNAPLLINPANTGFEPDADWRAGINYRNQWAGVSNYPYKTMSAWGDAQLFNNRFESGWMGTGLAILKDVAGSGNLSSTKVYGSLAYHQMLGYNSLLSGGFGIGAVNKRIDLTKLTFNDQWNGKFFDVTIPTNEVFNTTSIWYLDLNVGLNYAVFPSDNAYINAGISVNHLNMPNESFFGETTADTRVPMRFNGFINGSFKLNNQWIVNPNVYVSLMSKSTEIVGGMNAHYNLSGDGTTQLIGGLYYRAQDALIPMIGVVISGISATVSYDATSSTLGTYNQTLGAYEISITKVGIFSEYGSNVKCPSVRF